MKAWHGDALRRLAVLPLVVLVLGACSPSGGTPGSSLPAVDSPTPGASVPAPATRIEVTLTDTFQIALASTSVPVGVPVTFVVTNEGAIAHEFYLGDEAAQTAHEQEMADGTGMIHDEPGGIGLEPGETKELTYTFGAVGRSIAGCHVPGHYAAGMRSEISVVP